MIIKSHTVLTYALVHINNPFIIRKKKFKYTFIKKLIITHKIIIFIHNILNMFPYNTCYHFSIMNDRLLCI